MTHTGPSRTKASRVEWTVATKISNRSRKDDTRDLVAERLFEAEALYRDFEEVTPFEFQPFVKCFDSFEEFERWKRAQSNPWYR